MVGTPLSTRHSAWPVSASVSEPAVIAHHEVFVIGATSVTPGSDVTSAPVSPLTIPCPASATSSVPAGVVALPKSGVL